MIVKLFKGFVIKWIIKKLKEEDLREMIVTKINSKLDIPHLNEEQEQKLLNGLRNSLFEAFEDFLFGMLKK